MIASGHMAQMVQLQFPMEAVSRSDFEEGVDQIREELRLQANLNSISCLVGLLHRRELNYVFDNEVEMALEPEDDRDQ